MIVYILKSSLLLAILYSCYYILLNKETFHRFNRITLLGIMIVSLGLPLVKVVTEHPTGINTEICNLQSGIESPMYGVTLKGFEITARQKNVLTWSESLSIIYYIGVAVSMLLILIQIIALLRYMKGGLRHTDSRGNTIILKSGNVSPYSIFHFIVMSVDDYEHNRKSILTHEQEHIRLHHSYDLILLEIVRTLQWFNPFVWFLAKDLHSVHEYEADEAVINQGIDAKQYQQLLVTKAVGNRLQPLTNNLRRGSLKNRITMMYQKKSNRWMMLKALFVLPVAAFAISAFAEPKIVKHANDVIDKVEPKSVATPTDEEVNTHEASDNVSTDEPLSPEASLESVAEPTPEDKVYDKPDVLPVYPGGESKMWEYMMKTVKYPSVAMENGVQGQVIISFVVKNDGSISEVKAQKLSDFSSTEGTTLKEVVVNSYAKTLASTTEETTKEKLIKEQEGQLALIAEAERVISAMPKWTPGQVKGKGGKMQPVNTRFTMPISFRLN